MINFFAKNLNSFFVSGIKNSNIKMIIVDFKLNNKIIEFDGSYWHGFQEVIKKDDIKTRWLIKKGYNVLRIKEKEYCNNKNGTKENCLKFLKGDKYEAA